MRIVTIILSILILASFSFAQDWEWSLSAQPDLDAGINGISMLPDGETGWAIGNNAVHGIIIHTIDGWLDWTDQTDTTLTTAKFYDVSFVDELNGWIVGASGTILHTSDGGQSWEIQGAGVASSSLKGVSAIDASTAFAAGSDGTIVYTNDGANWSAISTGTTSHFYGIDMFDATHGIAVGKGETIYFTTDGLNWQQASGIPNIGGKDFNAVAIADDTTAWLVGDGFSILALKSVFAKTTDGGNTWTLWENDDMIMENMWAIDFTSPTKGVAVGHKGWVFTTNDGNDWTPLPRFMGNSSDAVNIVGDKIWVMGGSGTMHYSENFGANWESQAEITGQNQYKIGAADNNRIMSIGYSSTIIQSNDGGAAWKSGSVVADNDISLQLWGIDFINSNIGWVAGSGGFIAKTTDGGESWNLPANSVTTEWLRAIKTFDENTLWTVGAHGTIMKSENGGTDWASQGVGITSQTLYDIDGIDQNHLAIVGNKSTLLYSTDSGLNWQNSTHDLTNEKKISDLFLLDDTHGWAVGNDGVILFTADVGATWTKQNTPTDLDLSGVGFKDATTGWIAGEDGIIFETTDAGANWAQIEPGLTEKDLKSMVVTEDDKVFICGYNGTIVRYGPKIPSAIETTIPISHIENFELMQNYPNPFNPTTEIRYSLSEPCNAEITIFNMLGEKVITLVSGFQQPGKYAITWDGRNASNEKVTSGVYLFALKAGNHIEMKKMLLLK